MIINADSMQLYRELRILTARPSPADEARVPHRLYGVLAADQPGSAGQLARAGARRRSTRRRRRAGRRSWSAAPGSICTRCCTAWPMCRRCRRRPVPRPARLYRRLGGPAFHAELQARDPVMAARLAPHDRQRLIRAFEVVGATGRSLADWQADAPTRVALPQPVVGLALMPPRAEVYARIGRAPGGDGRGRRARRAASAARPRPARRTCRC